MRCTPYDSFHFNTISIEFSILRRYISIWLCTLCVVWLYLLWRVVNNEKNCKMWDFSFLKTCDIQIILNFAIANAIKTQLAILIRCLVGFNGIHFVLRTWGLFNMFSCIFRMASDVISVFPLISVNRNLRQILLSKIDDSRWLASTQHIIQRQDQW